MLKGWPECVFMLHQYKLQLYDLLTLPATLSALEDDQLKEGTHNDTQLFSKECSVRVCACV